MKDSSSATERVGRYQLLEPIGGGPNGMVARAKVFGVAGFERQFAVKRFASELTVGAVAQQLSAAARSYGSLEHPRIARMSEFGVAQGQTFTAVEYVAGLDAFRLLQEAKLAGVAIAAGGALALVSQAARAVGYAHGRGLSHLGLCPTNVIVTVDGDVKVTDFGILAATMPTRAVESPRLAHRIPYLAPEQLAGESTSAATDVFVLGVIAYELVTGQRAYRGDTPAVIAQAILAGPPAEPPLPRPIVRVLQRCLARSPFERFPDARALADALDAALRVAPVPGTRKDIGVQIKVTLDRYAALNEGNLSGMVALNLHNAALPDTPPLDAHDISTQPFMRPEAKTDVSPIVPSAGSTMPDMAKPFTTVAGLAPPPIPVPPGVTPPPSVPPPPAPGAAKTMLGLSPMKKAQIPGIIPPIAKPNGPPRPPTASRTTPPPLPVVRPPPDEVIEPSGLLEIHDLTPPPASGPSATASSTEDSGKMPAQDPATMQGLGPGTVTPAPARAPKPTPGQNFETLTGEMSPVMRDELNKRAALNTTEMQSLEPTSTRQLTNEPTIERQIERTSDATIERHIERSSEATIETPIEISAAPRAVDDAVDAFASDAQPVTGDRAEDNPRSTMLGVAPSSRSRSASWQSVPSHTPVQPTVKVTPRAPSTSKLPAILIALLALGGLGVAGWFAYTTFGTKDEPSVVAKGSNEGSAKQAVTPPPVADAGVAQPAARDAAVVAVATPDAAAAAPPADAAVVVQATIDAGTAKTPEVKPTATSDKLVITSKPAGARVFIDGADQGVTPLKLAGSADRHTMVLLLPNHDLYIGEVDGHGVFDIALKPVTPTGGHAGIKVLKCKAKERYYVYVDGAPTGMTCPTERIDTVVGNHVVEVYDIVTDSRRKFDVFVKDERLSARVRIDD